MILHETCHALIEGPESLTQLDWGLPNAGVDNRVHEHACLRLQAALADQVGMRQFFAATTMFRAYYDQLPTDPLAEGEDPAIPLARAGWERAKNGEWGAAIDEALQRSAEIARVVREVAGEGSLWHGAGEPDRLKQQ
jgi:hypothetical protein